jgi:hypothetical protein
LVGRRQAIGLRVVSAINSMRCSQPNTNVGAYRRPSPSLSSEARPSILYDLPDFVELMFSLMLASVSER